MWSVRLVRALDLHHRVSVVPFQKLQACDVLGLAPEQCGRAAWGIAPDGRRYRGAGAMNAAVAVAAGTRLPLVLYGLPGIRWLEDQGYSLVARYRSRLWDGTPYCQQFPGECD